MQRIVITGETKHTNFLHRLVGLVFGAFVLASGAVCPLQLAGDEVALWGRWEGRFDAAAGADADTQLAVELFAPSGKSLRVQGFWDGENTWRARTMPDELGVWKFLTHSQPPIAGLDGQSGEFHCRQPHGENRLALHGAIRVARTGTYLEHADGTPFFWLGDTVWNGPILSTKQDWDRYLADRTAKKFTVVQYNALAPWRTAPTDEQGEVAFSGRRENVRINPKYFQRLDRRIDAINDAGLVAAHVLVWSLREQDPGNYLPESDVIKLAKYQLARYGAHHVAWILAGDNPYDAERADRWKRIGRTVFEDAAHAPVTTHPTGMNWPWETWRDERWLDIFGYQSGHGDDDSTLAWIHSGPVKQAWQHHASRPIINLEPPYEDHIAYQSGKRHSAHNVRRAVYWSLLSAPTAGVTYGGHGMWSWQTEEGPPRDHERTGTAKPWHQAKDLPGAGDMQRVVELFTSLAWWTLRPADNLVAEQPGEKNPAEFIAAARSTESHIAISYLPVGGQLQLANSPKELGLSKASWFNPRTGQSQPATAESQTRFQAPDGQDWVLLLTG
jgi:hypothetical protein